MAELTVASTTDTQKDIDQAAGAQAVIESAVAVVDADEPEEGAELEAPKPKAKSGFQKRIDELTRQAKEAQRERDAFKEKLEKTETKHEPEVVAAEVAPSGHRAKPTSADVDAQGNAKYMTYEDYIEDLTDWKLEQREAVKAQEQAKQAEQAAQQAVISAYHANLAAFKTEHPDFEAVVKQSKVNDLSPAAFGAILELGVPEVAYHLAQNPELCAELVKMGNAPRAAAKIGQLAAQLEKAQPVIDDSDEEEPEERPVTRATNSAPAPIRPVGGSATKSSVPIDELDYQSYRKIRDQQAKNRYRR